MPRYQGNIINALIDRDAEDFSSMLLIFVMLSAGTMVFSSVQSVCVEIVQRRIMCDMRTAMFQSLVKQDIAFFDGVMTGQLTSRMTNDVAAVVQPVRQIMNTLMANVLKLIGGLFMCLFTSWKLTVLASTMIGPVVYLTGVYAKWSKQINLAIRVNMADANAVATEALRNIRTVRSFGADQIEVGAFRKHMDQALQGGMKDAYASAGVSAVTQYLDFAATILILWYGGFAVLGSGQSELKIGHLITFNLYWNMLNNSITGLNGMLNTLVRAASAAQRVFEIIELEPDISLNEGDVGLSASQPCTVEFDAVKFSYPMRPDKPVLHGLEFTIEAGQTVAVVGRSGAGKSTLVSLLLRFYDPKDGTVLLNGRSLSTYDLRSYQKRVGVVSQDTQVFCRPVFDNLTYGLEQEQITEAKVVASAQAANAHGFISELDDGYQSMIGEGGVRLSGGQRQRLAIARALLRQPSLLLLDEATSALDAENEGKVQEAIDELVHSVAGNCTVMLIAHRLSTVKGADKIVVLDSAAS
jgi:ATP-binding cassette subfamily B protein